MGEVRTSHEPRTNPIQPRGNLNLRMQPLSHRDRARVNRARLCTRLLTSNAQLGGLA